MSRDGVLAPGSVIGILGGGQLGRMLALAAAELGFRCHVYAPKGDNPAFDVTHATSEAAYEDMTALAAFADKVAVVTYEFENVPIDAVLAVERRTAVLPRPDVLRVTQDRLLEKRFVAERGFAVPPFRAVSSTEELGDALQAIGRPAVLKSRRLGYDGKGQVPIRDGDDPAAAFAAIGGVPAIVEEFVPFATEISVIAARGRDGQVVAYDVPENRHRGGILRRSTVPATILASTTAAAIDLTRRLMIDFGYVGVMAVELFVIRDDEGERLMVNEIAPRVHNSGHWTRDACVVSQFEQHVRAIAGWPLGDPSRHSDAEMDNLIGAEALAWEKLAAESQSALHLYGKGEARSGRKMGHVTRLRPRKPPSPST